jgi:hypothetical protein
MHWAEVGYWKTRGLRSNGLPFCRATISVREEMAYVDVLDQPDIKDATTSCSHPQQLGRPYPNVGIVRQPL